MVFDFATRFVTDNPEISLVGDYNFSDSDYDSFKQFLSDKDYDYVTKSEKKLEELQKAAEKEKYFENAKSEFEALQERLSHNKEADLVTFKDEIIKELEFKNLEFPNRKFLKYDQFFDEMKIYVNYFEMANFN